MASRLPGDEVLPLSLTTISQPLLQDQMVTTLSDALQNVAGVNVQTGNGPFDLFFLRGFDSVSSALVLVDGAPEPESTMLHLYNVDSIEVLKGAGGFLFGGRALAGTVNLVKKAPVLGSFANFSLDAGSYSFLEAQVDANHAFSGQRRLPGERALAGGRQLPRRRKRRLGDQPDLLLEKRQAPSCGSPTSGSKRTACPTPAFRWSPESIPRNCADFHYASSYDHSNQQVDRFQLDLEHQLRRRMEAARQALPHQPGLEF